jgi:hypothetical protein
LFIGGCGENGNKKEVLATAGSPLSNFNVTDEGMFSRKMATANRI